MDPLTLLLDPNFREVSAIGIVTLVVLSLLTGWLVPGRTHKRELADRDKQITVLTDTGGKKDVLIKELLTQNGTLLATSRIAEKFFGSFLPSPPDEPTQVHPEVKDVVS